MTKLAFLPVLLLVACAGAPVENKPPVDFQAQSLPAPTQGCAWRYLPIWATDFNPLGCAVVQACPGTVIAPLNLGSDGRCELPGEGNPDASYCDDSPRWNISTPDEVVVWQREGETRPVQYNSWPCGI